MNIYVGNLSREITADELRQAFEEFGQVETVNIIKDKYSGESKGFGFVVMPSKDEGQSAIDSLNGKELKGRTLNVNEARPRTDNRGGKGGFGGAGRGGGRGGFGGGGKGGGRGGFGGGGKGGGRGGFGGGGGRSRGGDR
ncbi:MAG TPA: RNA-binding protein [Nitrospirae bacterium]|nr:RNA recognition motif [bacterium BMS3Abin06]HDH12529.1 RNA-binding protein [Nitrospirota bacterium]HDZ00688.1 RNA-binding protein [Nitrospirota bacterium]